MGRYTHQIDRVLDRAASAWKWLRLTRLTADTLIAASLILLMLGVSMNLHWINSSLAAVVTIAFTVIVLGLVWFIRCIMTFDREPPEDWLAGSVEQVQAPLMDRLNTLVELDEQVDRRKTLPIRRAIARQTNQTLASSPERNPFPLKQAMRRVLMAVLMMTATVWYYSTLDPFQELNAAESAPAPDAPTQSLEIPELPPKEDELAAPPLEDESPWSEIRISEPGMNLRITRDEDVPLVIEAAASQPLISIEWRTSTNNATEITHTLPPSEDPRYAVHKPTIRPQDYELEDWDVLKYRAVARCEGDIEVESLTYFIEIVPIRDEIEAIPDEAIHSLEQLTGLLERQQQVIRETELLKNSADPPGDELESRLAGEERAIANAAQLLDSSIRDHLRQQGFESPTELSEPLEFAGEQLTTAAESLDQSQLDAAIPSELRALEHLAAARKALSQFSKLKPEAFQADLEEQVENTRKSSSNSLDATKLADLLKQLERQTSELDAAAESLKQLASQQSDLAAGLQTEDEHSPQEQAEKQKRIADQFENLLKSNPAPFQRLKPEVAATREDLQSAAEQLAQPGESKHTPAELNAQREAAEQAASSLNELSEQIERRSQETELAQADSLQQRLQQNIDNYARFAAAPQSMSDKDARESVAETKALLEELARLTKPVTKPANEAPSDTIDNEVAGENTSKESEAAPSDLSPEDSAPDNLSPDNAGSTRDESTDTATPDTPADAPEEDDPSSEESIDVGSDNAQPERGDTSETTPSNQSSPSRPEHSSDAAASSRETDAGRTQPEATRSLPELLTSESQQAILEQGQSLINGESSRQKSESARSLQKSLEEIAQALERETRQASRQLNQDQLSQLLEDMESNQQKLADAREFVQQTQTSQQSLRQRAQASLNPLRRDDTLEQDQMDLGEAMDDFLDERGNQLPQAEQELQSASEAMDRAEQSLERNDGSSPQQMQRAADELQLADDALARQQQREQVADQQRLREAMQRAIDQLEQMEKQPETASKEDKSQTAQQCNSIAGQCQKLGNSAAPGSQGSSNTPATPGQASPLQKATSPAEMDAMESSSSQLSEAQGNDQTRSASGDLSQRMQALAEAFDQTFPGFEPGMNMSGQPRPSSDGQNDGQSQGADPRQAGQQQSGLRPQGFEAIQRGLQQLESAARQQSESSMSPGSEQRLKQGAQADLSTGIQSEYGYNDRTRLVIQQMREELEEKTTPVDADTLEKLQSAISRLQSDRTLATDPDLAPDSSDRVDLSRFPPEYRESIRRYFESLSEQK